MNSEKELINQIKSLRQIKPDTDWAVLAKARILGAQAVTEKKLSVYSIFDFAFRYRAVFAGFALAVFAGGTIITAQGALPGETLYSLKKATERGVAIITGQDKNPAANLLLAAKRLEEIDIISQKNLVNNLPAAVNEYKNAKAAAKKEMAAMVKKNPDKAGMIVREAAVAMKNIDNKEKQVYAVLGLEINASSTENSESELVSERQIVESLIDYFRKDAVLSEDQLNDLAKVREFYDSGQYRQALDYYLASSLNK